jgi:anthranilate/para-aminobenzoate synthase component I
MVEGSATAGVPPEFGALRDDAGREAYERSVERIREYIRSGDVYQANLARRLVAPVDRDGDALGLYEALLGRSPAAFGAVIEADGVRIVSGSPERFLARRAGDDRLETRPIKGTRRRTGNAIRDARIAAGLVIDEKECAEHLMIVDLERNDLGRVARTGSVQVEGLGYLVELPTLYHLVSTVSCRLREAITTADILRATFPGGSITGAPKIRAMEIIDELEPVRRGPYTGAIGYLGRGGAIDLSIVIRAAVLSSNELRLHVGGGIVADSTPAREYEETEEKAAAWRAALSAVTTGGGDDETSNSASNTDSDGNRGPGRRSAG